MNSKTAAGLLVGLAVVLAASGLRAEAPETFGAKEVIPLYEGVAPGSEGWKYEEKMTEGKNGPAVSNVTRPVLLYFPAKQKSGTAMVVAPGGGFRVLMMSYEGHEIAKKLNEAGIDAFVLKYRLIYTGPGGDKNEPATTGPQAGQDVRAIAEADGRRAVELVRSSAKDFDIDPKRIGMIGFSAGNGPIRGAMAGAAEARPNFAAMIYSGPPRGGKVTLPEEAPPLFIAVTADDGLLPTSLELFNTWKKANVQVELHVFQMGGHGFLKKGGGADFFMDRVIEWMRVNGWVE